MGQHDAWNASVTTSPLIFPISSDYASVIIFMASYATGTGNIAWHGSELFPLELRGIGSSLMTASCWSMNIIVSATFLSMLSGITAAGTFGFYAGMCFVRFSPQYLLNSIDLRPF
jgi:hypothetical protein